MHEILTILSVLDAPIDFLDVGANTGKTSLPVIFCMHPKHRVLAVEPIEKNINSLLHSRDTLLAMNATESDASDEAGRLVVEKIALSDRAANGHMFFPASRGDNAALNRQASTIVFKDDVRRESVRMETADAFLKRHNAAPKLIKIDVQGSEIRVLKGMKNYLSTHSGVMVLAEHDLRLLNSSGFAPTVVYDFMKALDYAVYCHPTVVNRKGALFIQGDEHPREKIATVPCSDLTYWKRNR